MFTLKPDPESTAEAPTDDAAEAPADNDTPPIADGFEAAKSRRAHRGEGREDRRWYAGDTGRAKGSRASDLEVDPRWIGALEDHLGDASDLLVRVRKGASDYADLFSQAIVFVDGEQGRDAADRMARDIFAACVRHTQRHGPVLDFQLVIRKRGRGKKLEALSEEAIRISLIEPTAEAHEDDPADPLVLRALLSHTSGMLREARFSASEHRTERGDLVRLLHETLEKMPVALAHVGGMIQQATALHDAGARKLRELIEHEIDRERARFEAEFNVAKIEAIASGIKSASEIFSGEAGAAFLQWLASRGGEAAPETLQDAAGELANTLTVAQAEIIGTEGATRLRAALLEAATAADEGIAFPAIARAMAIVALHPELLETLSPRQRLLAGFIRGRNSAASAAG